MTIVTNTNSGGGTAKSTKTDTTNFDHNLSSADDTVQKALDTIDDISLTGTDSNAVHVNASSEIYGISEKASPVNADILIIEDSADSNNKKKVQIGNLPGGTGTPGGSDTQVQFNDGGAFGGDANFVWDKINGRLGIGTSSPAVVLDVYSSTNSTINLGRQGIPSYKSVWDYSSSSLKFGTKRSDSLKFITNDVIRMIIDESGDYISFLGDIEILHDNAKLYFGAGNDAYMEYDGNNMIINPKTVGSGELRIRSSASIRDAVSAGDVDFMVYNSDNTGYAVNRINTAGKEFKFAVYGSNYSNSSYKNNALLVGDTGIDKVRLCAQSTSGVLTFHTTGFTDSEERMRIDSSGNVGIGTSSPNTDLEIQQRADASGITINGYDDQSGKKLEIYLDSSGYGNIKATSGFRFLAPNSTNIAYITGSNSDGFRLYDNIPLTFGTTSATKYHIVRDSTSGDWQLNYGSYTGNDFILTADSSLNLHIPNDNAKLFFGAGDDASIYYDGTDMYINPAEVGNSKLYILKNVRIMYAGTATGVTLGINDDNTGFFSPDTNEIGISTKGIERMRIDSSGNVGVGTSSPSELLHIQETDLTADKVQLVIENLGGNSYAGFQIKNDNANWEFRIKNNDDFEIWDRQIGVNKIRYKIENNGGDHIFYDEDESELLKLDAVGNNVKIPHDNTKLYFGAGDDASITWDGLKFIIDAGASDLAQLADQPTGGTDLAIATTKYVDDVTLPASQISITDSDNEFNATEVESALNELAVKEDKNGFDRYDTDSMPDTAFDYTTRTVTVSVKSGQSSFHFWVNNKKVTKTSSQTVTIPDTSGAYYIYFDDSGTLQYVLQSGTPDAAFYKYAIVAFVYYNADNPSEYMFNPDELHGKDMSGITHAMLHNTFGAQYSEGLAINGLVSGNTSYTQSTSGVIYDEDIKHSLAQNTSGHAFLYRDGASGDWRKTSASLDVAYKESGDTYYSWNENTSGTTYQLTEGTSSTDYWMTFFLATPRGIMKIIGQNAYNSVRNARNAIETEVDNLKTNGLPNPEFVFLGAVIVKRDGKLQEMADGSVWYPLTTAGRSSAGVGSGTTVYAADVPTDTTNFNTHLSTTDTDVQMALETLDDHTHTVSQISDLTATASELNIMDGVTATASEINVLDGITSTTAELNYVDGVTSSIQTQLDAKGSMDELKDDTTPQLGGDLDLNGKLITEELTAGEALSAGDWCYLKSDGKYWKTDADAEATVKGKIRMATESISADATGTFAKAGKWTTTGLTAGGMYFLSGTAGEITTTAPSSGTFARVVGYAESTTVLDIEISNVYVEVD